MATHKENKLTINKKSTHSIKKIISSFGKIKDKENKTKVNKEDENIWKLKWQAEKNHLLSVVYTEPNRKSGYSVKG